ncbi:D-lyxose/D-mannose family sugar isomerase [Alicyclobacillus fastidiosus]|uniref:D-lyxose ketol-isomerase n=1 Tax=Alicyclobacillus fastidiosus TaxID=392011 RepID=A0ABY6ZCU7_9BACL|nr:D-lyxose/D-mannose family sugar isomerase [Alicyclobacillus fastidiosus]WAH40667.1 D-lyxose/D-mannose family sugar isomerase [Alicyclobacillus fastidiosus]GMA62129.1 D-lyxose isomerase [Alicyclobacillus fastidiosus]
MIKNHWIEAKGKVLGLFQSAHIFLTEQEQEQVEIVDFGLGNYELEGLGLVTYINSDLYCAKELALLPHQTCPEHRHPQVGPNPGKTETFRCRWGKVRLYLEGEPTDNIKACIPEGSKKFYTVFREMELTPGQQMTIPPNTLHWFQAAEEGAVVSEFSTTSRDEFDIFTDPRIVRIPVMSHS